MQNIFSTTSVELKIMELTSKIDFMCQIGKKLKFLRKVFRAHIETILHKKVAHRLREIRNDTIWINGEDIATAFKPMKMGLRVAHLAEPWETFLEKYQRVRSTYEELYRINLTE